MIKKIDINIENMVYEYPTINKEGFIQSEIDKLLTWFPTINIEKFNDAMIGNTCIMINDEIINYHCDVYKALVCGFENRNLRLEEWD
jgi:hypothetical protein